MNGGHGVVVNGDRLRTAPESYRTTLGAECRLMLCEAQGVGTLMLIMIIPSFTHRKELAQPLTRLEEHVFLGPLLRC